MRNMPSVIYITYVIVGTLLFFWSTDKRSSAEIANDAYAEEFSMHQAYDPDSMHNYYDAAM